MQQEIEWIPPKRVLSGECWLSITKKGIYLSSYLVQEIGADYILIGWNKSDRSVIISGVPEATRATYHLRRRKHRGGVEVGGKSLSVALIERGMKLGGKYWVERRGDGKWEASAYAKIR